MKERKMTPLIFLWLLVSVLGGLCLLMNMFMPHDDICEEEGWSTVKQLNCSEVR